MFGCTGKLPCLLVFISGESHAIIHIAYKIIFLGDEDEEMLQLCKQAGMTEVLVKPVTKQQLLTLLCSNAYSLQ